MTARIAATALVAICLAGCVTLLPKTKPAQLYRFGAAATAPTTASPGGGAGFTVRATSLSFDRAAASDRILTVNGDQAAYVAGSRWITSADSLFEAALTNTFESHQGPARLLAPGEPSVADYMLKVDVRTFEARYDHGAGATPTVVVEAYAAMVKRGDAKTDNSRLFKAEAPASSNSMSGIVAGFDQATAKVLSQMVTWVNAKGSG